VRGHVRARRCPEDRDHATSQETLEEADESGGGFAVMIIENGLYMDAFDISGVIAQVGKLDLRVSLSKTRLIVMTKTKFRMVSSIECTLFVSILRYGLRHARTTSKGYSGVLGAGKRPRA